MRCLHANTPCMLLPQPVGPGATCKAKVPSTCWPACTCLWKTASSSSSKSPSMCSRVRLGGRQGPPVRQFSHPDRCADLRAVSCRQLPSSRSSKALFRPAMHSSSTAASADRQPELGSGVSSLMLSRRGALPGGARCAPHTASQAATSAATSEWSGLQGTSSAQLLMCSRCRATKRSSDSARSTGGCSLWMHTSIVASSSGCRHSARSCLQARETRHSLQQASGEGCCNGGSGGGGAGGGGGGEPRGPRPCLARTCLPGSRPPGRAAAPRAAGRGGWAAPAPPGASLAAWWRHAGLIRRPTAGAGCAGRLPGSAAGCGGLL